MYISYLRAFLTVQTIFILDQYFYRIYSAYNFFSAFVHISRQISVCKVTYSLLLITVVC